MSGRTVLVAGATGALGFRIAQRLAARGERVLATYRTPKTDVASALSAMGCTLQRLDLSDLPASAKAIAATDAAVLTPILTASGPAARRALEQQALQTGRRVVLFSSNNVTVDLDSPIYTALRAEEAALQATAGDWALIRPTMIYGHPDDGNMSRLIRFAQRRPVLPMPGSGRALQQPIHVDDLADLAIALLDAPSEQRIVPAAGPRALSQRAVYDAVRRAAGRSPPIVAFPAPPLALAAALAERLRLPFPLSPDQIGRLECDKTPPPDPPAPAFWKAQTSLEDGLARLAEALAPRRPLDASRSDS